MLVDGCEAQQGNASGGRCASAGHRFSLDDGARGGTAGALIRPIYGCGSGPLAYDCPVPIRGLPGGAGSSGVTNGKAG